MRKEWYSCAEITRTWQKSAFMRPTDPTPASVNDLKTTFGAIFFYAQLTGSRKVCWGPHKKKTPPIIANPCLFGSSCLETGHQLGISVSSHHCVKLVSNSFWANNLNATTSTHISYSQDAIQNSFYWVSVFFSVIIQCLRSTGRKKSLYLCNQASPSSSCSNSWGWLPSLVRQTATVTTVL